MQIKCKATCDFVGQKNEGGFITKGKSLELPPDRFKTLKGLGLVKELKATKQTKELKVDKDTKDDTTK